MNIKGYVINPTALAQTAVRMAANLSGTNTAGSGAAEVSNASPPSLNNNTIVDTVNISPAGKTSGDSTGDTKPLKKQQDAKGKDVQESLATASKAYYSVENDTNRVVIKIVDNKGNVVKQIPPEDYLKAAKLMNMTTQELFYTKA
ncbi:flagellar protein FlaG [Candidatus Magnetomonas plexicatena]|uniref:flagellar protein FlaG n=1 Tax=Candidatus Magnetomonas plexicatena TaxID=2552947 RepID=UPI0011026F44|nr:flagellar protein FlaG [Nitrospirales bacterium LBB_01]